MIDLAHLQGFGGLAALDLHFAKLMMRLAGETASPDLALAAALVSAQRRQGHTCLPLGEYAGKTFVEGETEALAAPPLGRWVQALWKTAVVGSGEPEHPRPLVLDGRNRLYLHRYWEYERDLAQSLRLRVSRGPEHVDEARLRESLDRYFGGGAAGAADEQRIAAIIAVLLGLCIISGGPGTGKTWTVARILAVLVEQVTDKPLSIALAAPTGKAAARLQESVAAAKTQMGLPAGVAALIPDAASTLHRLLGVRKGSPFFRHDRDNPLPHDVVVVDEASMVDLALMAKLVRALRPEARLILLGDRDQLASVEAGAVLGDLCGEMKPGPATGISSEIRKTLDRLLGTDGHGKPGRNRQDKGPGELGDRPGPADAIVLLSSSRRFREGQGIGELAKAINEGDVGRAVSVLNRAGVDESADLVWRDAMAGERELLPEIESMVLRYYAPVLQALSSREALALFQRFQIFCALREGPFGVGRINDLVESVFRGAGLSPAGPSFGSRRYYRGLPVMVVENDYTLGLFNGDVGITWPENEDKEANLRMFFPNADGTMRSFPLSRMPRHETVYAMTVHKSQGSEFDRVLMILPDRDFPILTRELLYTGITRARDHVELWASKEVLSTAIVRRVQRASGLQEALWEG